MVIEINLINYFYLPWQFFIISCFIEDMNIANISFNKFNAYFPSFSKTTDTKGFEGEKNSHFFNYPTNNIYSYIDSIKNKNSLSIYYYNDTHGNSDSMAGVVYGAKNFKNQNKDNQNFVLSAGDNFSGAIVEKNAFIEDLMKNLMEVDVSAIGNHEIDAGAKGFFDITSKKNLSFVASNVEFDSDNPMNGFVKKSIVKEKNGVKYGFIGAMPIDFASCIKKEASKGINVLDFDKTVQALQDEIDKLKKQGINRIILLSHTGYETDKKLVSNLDGVDIVIGGHSHSVVEGAVKDENLVKSKSGEPVIITQAGENGKYYGILNVEFDNKGVITKVQNNLYKSANQEKSPIIEAIKEKTLGKSPLVATIAKIDKMPKNRRIEPSAWTALMADSIKEELGVEVSFINSANIRKVPKAGKLTQRDIQESAPMKNNLIKTRVTQKQMIEAIKNAAKASMTSYEGYPGLIQGSGFTYKIDDKGNLLEFNIVDKQGQKTPININNPDDDITYSAAYDTFMAQIDGETPELAVKFDKEEFDFDKDKTTCDYLSKLDNKDNLVITYDNRIEIVET